MASLWLSEALWVLSTVLGKAERPWVRCARGCPALCSVPSLQDNGICLGRDDVKLPCLPSAACPGQGALRQLIQSIFKWPEPLKVKIVVSCPCAGRQVVLRDACVLLIEVGALLSSCFTAVSGVIWYWDILLFYDFELKGESKTKDSKGKLRL